MQIHYHIRKINRLWEKYLEYTFICNTESTFVAILKSVDPQAKASYDGGWVGVNFCTKWWCTKYILQKCI